MTDYGKGIPDKDIEKITEAFYMVDKSRSKELGGIGLGLSICSQIAQLHHAQLQIESKEHEYTKVTFFTTPLQQEH
ncbi:Sensor histidine kinase YycG [compost metagenome]